MLLEVDWGWRQCDQALPSSQADPSAALHRPVDLPGPPHQTALAPMRCPRTHTSIQWIHGPPFLRVTPGKCQLKEFTNTSTRPRCQGKFSWIFTLTPFLYAILISFFTGPPHQNLLGTTQAGFPSRGAGGAECGGNLFLGACIIPAVNACIWPGFPGLLYRAVDAVQSALLSVPDEMAIKDWVRGQAPKAISTPKWLIIIMCGLNQEPVMSCIH